MQFPNISKVVKSKTGWLVFVGFVGIIIGYLILYLFKHYKLTYATFILAAVIFPFAAIVFGDTKRLLWMILFICLPISVDITINPIKHPGAIAGVMISLNDMVLAVLYLLWFTELTQRKKTIKYFPEISIPQIFIIGFSCLSIIPAKNTYLSQCAILEVFKLFLTFLYLANNVETESDVKFIVSIIIFGFLFEGLLGFAQHRYDQPFWPRSLGGPGYIDKRIMGTWQSYNDYAWYLTFIAPIALSILFSDIHYLYKFITGSSLFICLGDLLWTDSRAGWISFAAAYIFVCPFLLYRIKGKVGLIKTFVTAIALLIFISPLYPRLSNKLYGRLFGYDHGSAYSRIPQYKVAYNIIKAKPFLGIGINNYIEVKSDYDDTQMGIDTITSFAVHNIFLLIAAELGIFGILSFLWFIVVIFYTGVKYFIFNEGFNAFAIIGMTSGILAFLVHGLVDVAPLGGKMYSFVWYFAGIIIAIKKIKIEEYRIAYTE